MTTTHRASKAALRNAVGTERDYLYKVFRAAMKEYITQTRREWSEQREEAQFQQQLDISATHVIRVDNSDIGFITAPIRDKIIWIHTICIIPEHQNKGFGTEVIRSVIVQAREQKMPLYLSVLKMNPARRLYERLGFRVTQESTHHYQMVFEAQK
jgi:ribosomal protein S18 acetylase RimI-like enzyme